MHATEFTKLVETAIKDGWAVGQTTLQALRVGAKLDGWSEVTQREGDPAVTDLRPVSAVAARAKSLSAKYGTGAQPLHTDGAHLEFPPDVVILAAVSPSLTPTLLWKGRSWEAPVKDGIFVVRSGGAAFLTTAWADGRFRFDPGCMEPADARARAVVEHFEEVRQRATRHEWTESGQVLVIDNTRSLHARAEVAPGDGGRVVQRVALRRAA